MTRNEPSRDDEPYVVIADRSSDLGPFLFGAALGSGHRAVARAAHRRRDTQRRAQPAPVGAPERARCRRRGCQHLQLRRVTRWSDGSSPRVLRCRVEVAT